MDLSDVSRAEPPLAVAVHGEILLLLVVALVVAHRDVGAADQNLASWMRFVGAAVATLQQETNMATQFPFFFPSKKKKIPVHIFFSRGTNKL